MGWSVLSKKPSQGWPAYLAGAIVGGEAGREMVASGIGKDGNFYAAIRSAGNVRAVVALIEGFGYKFMGEEEGPYYYQCPPDVLAALTPTDEPFALKWRAKCAEVAA